MKILNFGKIKKLINTTIKQVVDIFKRNYKESIVPSSNNAPSGSYNRRKGGWINYKFKLIPVNGIFPAVYRDFKRQKLIGSLYINGNRIYRICENN